MIIPIAQHKEGVLERADELLSRLSGKFRVGIDKSENSPGWKFAEYEMKGVPIRLEIGPKDIENGRCVLVRRDTAEKIEASLDGLEETVAKLLDDISANLLERAKERRDKMTYEAHDLDEIKDIADNKPRFHKGTVVRKPRVRG